MNFEEVISFTSFLHKLSGIMRTVKIANREGYENDAEHSYQVAMVSWFVAERLEVQINQQLLLEYALVHDLVEVYAGDTDMFISSEEHRASKPQKEAAALEKIKKEFLEFPSLTERLEGYEHLIDLESKIVCLVDKLLPDLAIYLSDDDYYIRNKVMFENWQKWFDYKLKKIDINDSKIMDVVNAFKQFVIARKPFYDPTK